MKLNNFCVGSGTKVEKKLNGLIFLSIVCLNGNNSSNENPTCVSQIIAVIACNMQDGLCACAHVCVCVSGWVVVVFMGCIIGALLFSTCLCSLLWNMKPNHYWTSELTAGHKHTHTPSADLCLLSQFQEMRADTNTQAAKMSIWISHSIILHSFSSFTTTNIIRPGIKNDSCFDSWQSKDYCQCSCTTLWVPLVCQ